MPVPILPVRPIIPPPPRNAAEAKAQVAGYIIGAGLAAIAVGVMELRDRSYPMMTKPAAAGLVVIGVAWLAFWGYVFAHMETA